MLYRKQSEFRRRNGDRCWDESEVGSVCAEVFVLSVPRAKQSPTKTGLRNCVIDEGRSFGAALQEEASNYPPLLPPKGSGGERRGKRPGRLSGQVTFRKRNESESPLLMSKIVKTISKPWFVRRPRDKFRRNLITGGTVSGI